MFFVIDLYNLIQFKYNEQVGYCKKLEERGKAIIVRPTATNMEINRFEREKNKLKVIKSNEGVKIHKYYNK